MPTLRFNGLDRTEDLEEQFAELTKLLEWLLNGQLDVNNIRAKSITADRMDVDELSAITANLGHIISGLIETVKMIGSEIYGSYIATAEGTYPRAEMSNLENLFAAYATANNFLKIYAIESGTPMVYFSNPSSIARLFLNGSRLSLANFGSLLLSATGDIDIESTGSSSNINLKTGASGSVKVDSWGKFYSQGDAQTLQTALNNIYTMLAGKANAFSGAYGSFETADGKTVTVSNGIITSMV